MNSPGRKAGSTCLSGEEICKIIRVSRLAGVSLLKLGDVEVQFGGQPASGPQITGPAAAPAAEIAALTKKIEADALQKGELDLREEQIAELVITDPVAYERMLANGELDEDGS